MTMASNYAGGKNFPLLGGNAHRHGALRNQSPSYGIRSGVPGMQMLFRIPTSPRIMCTVKVHIEVAGKRREEGVGEGVSGTREWKKKRHD